MRRKPMQFLLSAGVAVSFLLPACSGERKHQTTKTERNTTIQTAGDFGDSLDLSRLPSLVKQAKNGEELEEILNTSGVNNLDTNGDGKIDYLNVEEVRDNGKGFVLFTNEGGERMDIARVDVTQTQSTADVSVSGNPQYYGGHPAHYRSSFGLGEVLLAAWLFDLARPRYYHPGFYFGHYPTYYRSFYRGGYGPVVSRTAYRSRISSGSFTVKGKPMVASASKRGIGGSSTFSTGSSSRRLSGGSSFNSTTRKRPGGGFFNRGSSSGSSTTSRGSFGSNSNRTRPSFSFGGNSSRSSTGSSSNRSSGFGSSSGRSRSSSFGGSSSRRRR
ncbi:MAG: hypothetical protein ACAI44_36485 [Candidatus Sericytochromatia bacterium]